MNWSSNILAFLKVVSILTLDTSWYLFDRIFMASRFETHSKGWQNFSKPIGRLEGIERYTGYGSEKITSTADDDECIYYPLVYGNEDKLKIVVNPTHKLYKSQSKIDTQSPPVKGSIKDKKNIGYGTGEDGCYEILRSTVAQSSPPLKHHLASVRRDVHAPVSRSTLRALSNDFEQNKDRVIKFQPTTGGCRQSFRHPNLSKNNNYVYEHPKKANDVAGERRFVSPHFDDGFIEREDNEELLDYCTCMCCVKGAFYHLTKDSDNEGHIADQPCSCSGPLSQCLPRWGCLGVFSLVLPCICCYLPVKGCMKVGKTQRRLINSPPGIQSAK